MKNPGKLLVPLLSAVFIIILSASVYLYTRDDGSADTTNNKITLSPAPSLIPTPTTTPDYELIPVGKTFMEDNRDGWQVLNVRFAVNNHLKIIADGPPVFRHQETVKVVSDEGYEYNLGVSSTDTTCSDVLAVEIVPALGTFSGYLEPFAGPRLEQFSFCFSVPDNIDAYKVHYPKNWDCTLPNNEGCRILETGVLKSDQNVIDITYSINESAYDVEEFPATITSSSAPEYRILRYEWINPNQLGGVGTAIANRLQVIKELLGSTDGQVLRIYMTVANTTVYTANGLPFKIHSFGNDGIFSPTYAAISSSDTGWNQIVGGLLPGRQASAYSDFYINEGVNEIRIILVPQEWTFNNKKIPSLLSKPILLNIKR